MRTLIGALLLGVLAVDVTAFAQDPGTSPQPPASATPETQPPAPVPPIPANANQEINDRLAKQILEKIAGRENEPAEKVFKNVQMFKDLPAKRLLLVMNLGYSRALGVACTHCHVEQDFGSDEKRPKRAAREMAAMHRMINEQLKKMKNLETKPEDLAINCSTCHRGAIDPMASSR